MRAVKKHSPGCNCCLSVSWACTESRGQYQGDLWVNAQYQWQTDMHDKVYAALHTDITHEYPVIWGDFRLEDGYRWKCYIMLGNKSDGDLDPGLRYLRRDADRGRIDPAAVCVHLIDRRHVRLLRIADRAGGLQDNRRRQDHRAAAG